MRIGIVSFYDTQQNYGQILQCYALQKVFSDLGHSSFHLKYINQSNKSKIHKITKLIEVILHGLLPSYLVFRKSVLNSRKYCGFIHSSSNQDKRGFDEFRNQYIKFSDIEYSIDKLKSNPPSADVWVTGSDQVWGMGASELFQLEFAPQSSKKIAYAASMGGYKLSNKFQRYYFRKYLQKFDYISLRESDGVEECKALGLLNAHLVPDPTFLLPASTYRDLCKLPSSVKDKKYVFVYLLGNPIDIKIDEIYNWINKNGYEMIYVAAQGREDEFKKINATPQEWLGLIDNAEFVITNSFHGMAFSIIFNKQFMVIPISGAWERMNSRLTTTLDELHIPKERMIFQDIDKIVSPIDYIKTNKLLNTNRTKTIKKLLNVLDS